MHASGGRTISTGLLDSTARIRGGSAVATIMIAALVLSSCSAPAGTDDAAGQAGGKDCASGPAVQEQQKVKDMSPEEREATLVADAKAANKGSVSWYTELNDADIITGPFEDKYPGLTVAVYRAGTEDIRQRVIQESAAGYRGSDVIQLDYLGMDPLDKEGLLAPATSPEVSHLVPEAKFKNFTGDSLKITVPAWNPTQLPPDQAPKSLQDLADPRFKGKLAIEGTDVFWFAAEVTNMMDTQGMTKDQAVDVFRKIASNAAITDGHTATTEFVVAGQYAIAANNFVHRVVELQGKGAPIEWKPVQVPAAIDISTYAIPCQAGSPAGGMLLEDFVMSKQGQQALLDNGRTPVDTELNAKSLGGVDLHEAKVDESAIAQDYSSWEDLWRDVVQNGTKTN
jgi:iron(III) transport system substrate-binding protein